ncbi:MAG: hypothetical protein M3410_05825 [Acidobacteriota bacterium]|nr:hypothetical protein [Acidobacteriota bacterium]
MCRLKWTAAPSAIFLAIALATSIGPSALAQEATVAAPSPAVRQPVVYACSMHPDVSTDKPGNCIKCGIPLVPMAARPEVIEYGLKLETTPAAVKPGEKVQLRFLIFHPKTGQQVERFNITWDMPFHLFIVSQDLEYYDHIHPKQQQDGSFMIETVLPKAGHYKIFCDFFPTGGNPQVIDRSMTTTDSRRGDHHFLQTNLAPDKSLSKSVDGIRFELKLDPAVPVAGQPTLLRYYLVDDKTGLPVKNLQPYLGAWGHTATISEDATEFLHSHPTRLIPAGAERAKLVGRPRISFHTFFTRPGYHRIWSQFQREEKVITVSFTVYVSRLDRIAKWDGSGWSSLVRSPTNGLDGSVRALAVNGSDVYVGGDFTRVDGLSANRIARWDGRNWSALGAGVNGNVWAMAVKGSDVYVGGDFTKAGGVVANRIAKWDGSRWWALGDGISGCKDDFCSPIVYALSVSGSDVYAGGRFANAGGVAASGIGKWDGNVWSALGDGVRTGAYDGVVRALTVSGKDVYAGGQFVTAGRVSAYNIARWNGQSWSALGNGIRGNMEEVLAIDASGSNLYVGGRFSLAGGVAVGNFAKWNGLNWSPVEIQNYDGVRKIVVSGNKIYVGGGPFILTSGVVAKGIVMWNGTIWSGLGSGFGNGPHEGPIMAIAMRGNDIYIGGDSLIMPIERGSHRLHGTRHD